MRVMSLRSPRRASIARYAMIGVGRQGMRAAFERTCAPLHWLKDNGPCCARDTRLLANRLLRIMVRGLKFGNLSSGTVAVRKIYSARAFFSHIQLPAGGLLNPLSVSGAAWQGLNPHPPLG